MPFKDGTGPSQPGQGRGQSQGGCRGRQAANRAGLSHAGGQGGRGRGLRGRGQGAGTNGNANSMMSWMRQQLNELRSMVQQLTERLDAPRPDSHS
ncbi:hypothetical protein Thivi_0860 [Thiocystis violascens DSM 198]|uniref:Uncharacterized protein n=1 Tax=Thiocystis violascens (strain ATCC 17096 / DSM 198 / 6111) TaxID=765911 RepID=I3Y7D0_THIV6|nr:hypothetical protein Thivi_0860 [Thiocystis violascens DSM 198]